MLDLTISYKERIFEVLESMPKEPKVLFLIYQVIIIPKDGIVRYTYNIKDNSEFLWIEKELCRGLNPHAELKQAHKEGAEIEMLERGEWWVECAKFPPTFDRFERFRIKGGITIEQWGKHKEAIKAWWRGEPIECRSDGDGEWGRACHPSWFIEIEYRVALKPCPFCGGEAAKGKTTYGRKQPFIKCENCDCKTPNTKHCVQLWNRRA